MTAIELWGGVECTVNRVGDRYRDQIQLSGHHGRVSDLDRFADLGVAALRYPVLWERTAPGGEPDWRWPDARLSRLRDLGIRPIVGLVHHGSGPTHTHLLDPDFATGLGAFAGAVARRFPWVEEWTPVNEPLTTARFAALYGHWYPHAADERSCWLALLNQIDGVRAAMTAIRQVNPAARLVQTDDLGHTSATPPVAEQAAYENMRRWAGWDLLFGRVTPDHPLFEPMARAGLGDRLREIADAPCPPAVIGINHYLTSDRFLDHRLDRYPAHLHGGNGRQRYVDTEAVRVLDPPAPGLAPAMRAAWQRYRTPLALTEVHNGCTREEQLRWAAQAWDTAHAVAAEGADVRAVTAWSLLGSHGWNTLLTADGVYEPGVFELGAGRLRPTALATLWRGLPKGAARHPVVDQPGWWQRPERLLHRGAPSSHSAPPHSASPPLLICGADGMLGRAFVRACLARGIAHVAAGRGRLDLTNGAAIAGMLAAITPWAVVNAAGCGGTDAADEDEAACVRIDAAAAVALAQACAEAGIGCLNLSSDRVFAGDTGRPLVESDEVRPLGAYGRSKAAMEAGCAHLPGSLVIRTAACFAPDDPRSFAAAVLDRCASGMTVAAASDHVVSPTYVPALVNRACDLLIDGEQGIWHVSGGEAVSWADFARRVAEAGGHDPALIRPVRAAALRWKTPRPRHGALASERGLLSPSLDDGITCFARACLGTVADRGRRVGNGPS